MNIKKFSKSVKLYISGMPKSIAVLSLIIILTAFLFIFNKTILHPKESYNFVFEYPAAPDIHKVTV